MHNWILIDILEGYDENFEYVDNEYIIGCYTCEKVRVVKEVTFNKMMEHGLIEEVEV